MKQERSKIKSDILLRVRLLYVLFILAGLTVFARLVWVQLFSAEVAYNADRLASHIHRTMLQFFKTRWENGNSIARWNTRKS